MLAAIRRARARCSVGTLRWQRLRNRAVLAECATFLALIRPLRRGLNIDISRGGAGREPGCTAASRASRLGSSGPGAGTGATRSGATGLTGLLKMLPHPALPQLKRRHRWGVPFQTVPPARAAWRRSPRCAGPRLASSSSSTSVAGVRRRNRNTRARSRSRPSRRRTPPALPQTMAAEIGGASLLMTRHTFQHADHRAARAMPWPPTG